MVMERFDVDAVRAFELLTKLSQNSNTDSPRWQRRLFREDENRNPQDRSPPAAASDCPLPAYLRQWRVPAE